MICDAAANIKDYRVLSRSLEYWEDQSWKQAQDMSSFSKNGKLCTLFYQKEGESSIATSWRENNSSLDVTGVIRLKAGHFALFLPGERFICRPGGDCRLYTLE